MLSTKEKHMKPVKTRLNHYKHKKNPLIIMVFINSIRFRDKVYERLQILIHRCTLEENLRNFNYIPQSNINAAKRIHYETKFNKYVSNINKLGQP